jgi:hypothetical protein
MLLDSITYGTLCERAISTLILRKACQKQSRLFTLNTYITTSIMVCGQCPPYKILRSQLSTSTCRPNPYNFPRLVRLVRYCLSWVNYRHFPTKLPVLPTSPKPIAAFLPVPLVTTPRIIVVSVSAIPARKTRRLDCLSVAWS